jgi:hypothetical protein
MKTKKLEKKLGLTKVTIAALNSREMKNVEGGLTTMSDGTLCTCTIYLDCTVGLCGSNSCPPFTFTC